MYPPGFGGLIMYTDWWQQIASADPLLVQLPVLLVAGICAHLLLGVVVARLHIVASNSAGRWDDVALTAVVAPGRTILWLIVGFLVLDLFAIADGLRAAISSAYDTALVLLLAWKVWV